MYVCMYVCMFVRMYVRIMCKRENDINFQLCVGETIIFLLVRIKIIKVI